jgi:hypothetical protein
MTTRGQLTGITIGISRTDGPAVSGDTGSDSSNAGTAEAANISRAAMTGGHLIGGGLSGTTLTAISRQS